MIRRSGGTGPPVDRMVVRSQGVPEGTRRHRLRYPTAGKAIGHRRMTRRRFLRKIGTALAGGAATLALRADAAHAATCQVQESQIIYCQSGGSCHYCQVVASCGSYPQDLWKQYINLSGQPQSCSCLWVGCLSRHRCDGGKRWWMTFVKNTNCPCICT